MTLASSPSTPPKQLRSLPEPLVALVRLLARETARADYTSRRTTPNEEMANV